MIPLRPLALTLLLLCGGCRGNAAPSPPPPLRFTEITREAGISWRHVNGAAGRLYYPELVGGGGGFVDVDDDGRPDLVLVNSGALPGYRGDPGSHAVYLNLGGGAFRRVESGLSGPPYGMGLAAGDYDGDGRTDLYLTGLHEGRLYRNLGGGRFADVTTPALRNRGRWGTSATWADLDQDGRPDLFVGSYVRWSPAEDVPCTVRGLRTYCGPTSYPPDRPGLFFNRGGRFEPAGEGAGLVPGKALGVVARDLDGDGRTDLAVACDLVPNLLYRGLGGGRFEEIAVERGIAMNQRGLARAGMGIDAHEEEPRRWSIWIGNLTGEGTAYYAQGPDGYFEDAADRFGLLPYTLRVLTFGVAARDFDLDGDLDLVLANGHIDLLAERTRGESVRQPALLFRRGPAGMLDEITGEAGAPFAGRYLGRALAAGDLDNDGDPDLLLVENHGPARLWRNDTPRGNAWVGLDCRWGPGGSPALGARIEVTGGGRTQVRWVQADGSYLSAGDPRVVFGLGPGGRVERAVVRWPDGREEPLRGLGTGRYHRVEPGRPPVPLEIP